MPKRPNVVGDLILDGDSPDPTPERIEAPPRAKPTSDVQHSSIYIPRPVYERLRELAFHERVKIHDLILEGLDLVMAQRGHPERTNVRKRRRAKAP
jgi:hypothetical protein